MWKILIFLLASLCSGQVTVNGVPGQTIAPFSTTVNGQTCTIGSTCTIPLSAVNPQTATYQVLAADFSNYKTITVASGTFTITLVASGSQPAVGQYINVVNYGSGVVTVARSGQNINGGTSSLSLPAGSATAPTSTTVWSDGTNYFANLSGVSSAFSGLLAATGTNTIDNTNYAQTWNWSTATSQNLLSMNFNALTSGSALSLLTSNASLASTNGFLNVANTGAATGTSIFARLQPNSTSGSGLTVLNNSNVGIGTTSPDAPLHVLSALNANHGQIEVRSTNNDAAGLTFYAQAGGSTNARNWQVANNYLATGNLDIMRSTDNSGAPVTQVMSLDNNSNIGIGSTSPSYLVDIAKSSTSGTFRAYDQTATTGVTKAAFQDGAGQSTTPSFRITNNAGTAFSVVANGAVGSGIILTDSGGACWKIVPTISTGVLTSSSITCPIVP